MLSKLLALGATITCGHVDFKHTYLGQVLSNGELLLTPEGEDFVEELLAAPAPRKRKGGAVAASLNDDLLGAADE